MKRKEGVFGGGSKVVEEGWGKARGGSERKRRQKCERRERDEEEKIPQESGRDRLSNRPAVARGIEGNGRGRRRGVSASVARSQEREQDEIHTRSLFFGNGALLVI